MKKITMTLLTILMLALGASSAIADPAHETDSGSNPNRFWGANDYFTGTLTDYWDIDYFYYYNDTGSTKTYFLYLYNLDDPSLDYRFHTIGVGGPTPGYSSVYFDQVGRKCWAITVPANGEITATVRGRTVSTVNPTSRYEIILKSVPPAP